MTRSIYDYLKELETVIADMRGEHAELASRVERMLRPGKVTDVDTQKQLYRQEIGLDDDNNPVKSPWVPYAQFAGDRKIHTPPTVGQQFLLISPDGDHEQGHGIPYTFSKQNASPGTGTDHVDQWDKVKTTRNGTSVIDEVDKMKITHDADGFHMALDGTMFSFSKAGLDVQNGTLKHNGLDIGSSHKHTQVQPGDGLSGVPDSATS